MPDDYRNELGAAQAQIAKLREELDRARGTHSTAIRELEAQHQQVVNSMPKKNVVRLQLVAVVLSSVLMIPSVLGHGDALRSVGLPLFAVLAAAASVLLQWTTRSERKRQVELSERLLEETRRRVLVEQEFHALQREQARVRVSTESERGAPDAERDEDLRTSTPIDEDPSVLRARSR